MKKLNKKGFTLVELLAVVVILLAISVIAVSSISAAIERNKEKENEAKINVILSYARLYYDDHKNSLGSAGTISIQDLIEEEYMTEEERKDANDNNFSGIICYSNGSTFTYEKDGIC